MTTGHVTYAGFGPRAFALLIDTLVWAPFVWVHLALSDRFPTVHAMLYYVVLGTLSTAYPIYFLTRWGQTLGKMAAKIRVTRVDGGVITFKQALLRNSVDAALWIVHAGSIVYLLVTLPGPEWNGMSGADQRRLLEERASFGGYYETIGTIWMWSELIVLLFNKRRRALHDFIAGTVVVRMGAEK